MAPVIFLLIRYKLLHFLRQFLLEAELNSFREKLSVSWNNVFTVGPSWGEKILSQFSAQPRRNQSQEAASPNCPILALLDNRTNNTFNFKKG